jgi:hypothetical protein
MQIQKAAIDIEEIQNMKNTVKLLHTAQKISVI